MDRKPLKSIIGSAGSIYAEASHAHTQSLATGDPDEGLFNKIKEAEKSIDQMAPAAGIENVLEIKNQAISGAARARGRAPTSQELRELGFHPSRENPWSER